MYEKIGSVVPRPAHHLPTRQLLVLLLVFAPLAACNRQQCTRTWTSSGVNSPDGKWTARVQQDVCETGLSSTEIAVVVQRVSSSVVLRPSGQWRDPALIGLRWLGSETLEVSVPNRSVFTEEPSAPAGIRIRVRYENDDPADRAGWLKWREQYIDWVNHGGRGPSPVLPSQR